MRRDSGFSHPVPVRIPDTLLAEFQHDAERVVRRARRRSSLATVLASLRSADTWWAALVVFCVLVIVGGLMGGPVYAAVMWPWLMLYVLAPAAALFAVALVIAVRTRDRWEGWTFW